MITGHDVWTSDLERVSAIILRSMRRPILVLIAVSAVFTLGMVLVPGPVVDGKPTHMSFFHAVYFLTFTATTTGFGEIPTEFSDAQRLWVILALMSSVVAWVYAIGSIITLIQNPHFQQAFAQRQFSKKVQRIKQPYIIVCGFGDAGSLLTRGLLDSGFRVAVIDLDTNRIQALKLRDYPVAVPGLCANAGIPRHLLAAGLDNPHCDAVVALTNDEGINRKIVVMSHLINPRARTICRSSSQVEGEFLKTLNVVVVDPFATFAEQLSIALRRPLLHTLNQWLVGARGIRLNEPLRPPSGTWIVCGFGRMGRRIHETLLAQGIRTVVIDPDPEEIRDPVGRIVGHANAKTLKEAGVESAAGIVAATNSDSNNLGILLNARMLNPRLFVVVRQNRHDDEAAFEAANADLVMQPSLVTARHILLSLVSPLTQLFQEHFLKTETTGLPEVIARLQDRIGDAPPDIWIEPIAETQLPVHCQRDDQRYVLQLGDIQRDPGDRNRMIDCVPLVHQRGEAVTFLPAESQVLEPGDLLLICGTRAARHRLEISLHDVYVRAYLMTGVAHPQGVLTRWFSRGPTQTFH